ncbi:HNH endonuclease [Domibacillus aminovorans]|uniref:HNH endonuclease n=1 Tax=Domibacillus aminovorans TaxID=29332 RepID=UPI0039F48473
MTLGGFKIISSCGHEAPFLHASNGTPYLEVHHVIPLSKGGDDTVVNAQSLCPNCHRMQKKIKSYTYITVY